MSAIEQAIKKTDMQELDPVSAVSPPANSWAWLPNLLMFILLAVVLWNYLSEREYRRQMEARLETTISDLENTRMELRRVQNQHQEMEDLLHAELEASNGRIAKMKFDLDEAQKERDAADAARAVAESRVRTLESQNRRLHEVIQTMHRGRKTGSANASLSWESPASGPASLRRETTIDS